MSASLFIICAMLCGADAKFSVISGDNITWRLVNSNGSISVQGSVPGGTYSDLHRAGIIGDILAGFNDVETRWIAYDTWSYTGVFTVSEKQLEKNVARLVLEGVDTVSFIEVNDIPVGTTDNMFVRYAFDVKQQLKEGLNEIKVHFVSPVEAARRRSEKHFTAPDCLPEEYHGECHVNQLRKLQASFGWDWGPAFPSVGLWKPVFIQFYDGAIIRSVTTHIEKVDKNWDVKVRVYIESGFVKKHIVGYLSASLTLDSQQSIKVGKDLAIDTKEDGTAEVDIGMYLSENVVSLWWPNGYGDQPLYDLNVVLSTKGNSEVSRKHLRIGFRTVELIEEEMGNSSATKGLSFYFRVNGYKLFMKGANWIPMNVLPENTTLYSSRPTIENLLNSAKDAHMTMMRVWGGGLYESDYFYKRCDELGILIWQDLMFACSMYPADAEFLSSVEKEVEQNVIRLQHHPSIAIWAGNNENEAALRGNWYNTKPDFERYKEDYIKLYVDTIMPIVESLDPERRYLVSSPSNGLQSVKDGYIAVNPYDSRYGDTHYYNYLADNWNSNIYPLTRFASEYGFQSLPTLAAMKTATQDKKDFSIDSEYSKHRQHSPDGYNFIENQMLKHLALDRNDTRHFEKYVFYSQISQAMALKAETEFYRQSQADWDTMGALYWQLNDVWQAPSWSSIEYTGNWKMLHYFACIFFAPVLVSPRLLISGVVEVYLLNDRFVPIEDASIVVDVYNWNSFVPIHTKTYPAFGRALSSTKQDIKLDLWTQYNENEVFLRFSLRGEGVGFNPYNYVFPKPLKTVTLYEKPTIQISVSKSTDDGTENRNVFDINIKSSSIALFFWLETTYPHGYFEQNGVMLTEAHTTIKYVTKLSLKPSDLEKSITYQYYENETKRE